MSTDYSFGIAVGFEIDFDLVFKKWGKDLPELSHAEPRFDQRTGKQTKSEKVVDREACRGLVIGGMEYPLDDRHEIDEALDQELDAYVQWTSDNPSESAAGETLMISPKGLKFKDPSLLELDYGRVTGSGGFLVEDLVRALPKLKELGARLQKLGLRPKKPMVRITGGYG